MVKKIFLSVKSAYISARLFFSDIKKTVNTLFTTFSGLACLTSIILLILEFSFSATMVRTKVFEDLHFYLISFFFVDVIIRVLFLSKYKWSYVFIRPTDLAVIILFSDIIPNFPFSFDLFFSQMTLFIILVGRVAHLGYLLQWFKIKPAQVLILAFLFVIFIGGLLLSLPLATNSTTPIIFVDALFTAFSAVCVTGLVINNIGQDFSLFGQIIILMLIQIGGLGIMSFSVLLTLILKRRISPTASIELQENYSTININETFSAISFIFKFTIFFECLGAILLTLFSYNKSLSLLQNIYLSIFHSISAFCNAGFSLYENSLTSFATNAPVTLTISALIIFGGLGFPVLFNLFQIFDSNIKNFHLKMQTKLALIVTGSLTLFGTLFIFFSEYNLALGSFNWAEKLLISFFQSVSARTAGFNTIDLTLFHPGTLIILILLMIIGASPGSTGGGMKTTTFGVMIMAFWNALRSSFRTDYNKKTIDVESIIKSFSLLLISLIIFIFTFLLIWFTDQQDPFSLFFEIISAFGTVGYSLGTTLELSNTSKMIIMVLMFVGRIGPFTFLYALLKRKRRKTYAYPIEKYNII
tara:strand:- start:127 stop:1875 length:1749 start_codon:yes stop_codon:yes gene_type:complete